MTIVIATGSSAFVPPIEGLRSEDGDGYKDGLFVFRTLDDCDGIAKYAAQANRAAVIGGGLLGLEAACPVHPSQFVSLLPPTELRSSLPEKVASFRSHHVKE